MPETTLYQSVENIVLTVLALVVIIIFLGSLYSFVLAIFKFIFSHGDGDKIKQARNSIRYMIIGIILSLILLFAFPFVFKYLNVTGYKVYTARNIFNRAGELIQGSWSNALTIRSDFERYQNGESNNLTTPSTTPATIDTEL